MDNQIIDVAALDRASLTDHMIACFELLSALRVRGDITDRERCVIAQAESLIDDIALERIALGRTAPAVARSEAAE